MTKSDPKISIIMPAYNVGKYIEKSLSSIINQTFNDFELIIVDDGSSDDTAEKVYKSLRSGNINWHLISQKNRGVSAARNIGIKNAVGDKIIFIDPDDIIANNFLEELYHNSLKYNADLAICSYKYIKNLTEIIKGTGNKVYVFSPKEMLEHFLYRDLSFLLVTMLIDRHIIVENELFFDENIHFSEDQIFMWDVLLKCAKIIYSADRLYGYYLRENSTMTSSNKIKILDSYPLVAKKLSMLNKNDKVLKYALPRWKIGALYTSARLLDYADFLAVAQTMESGEIYEGLKGFKDFKARLFAFILKISNKLFYIISRKVN